MDQAKKWYGSLVNAVKGMFKKIKEEEAKDERTLAEEVRDIKAKSAQKRNKIEADFAAGEKARRKDKKKADEKAAKETVELTKSTSKNLFEITAKQAKDLGTWQDFMKNATTSRIKEVAAISKAMAIYEIGVNTYKAAMGAYSAMAGIPFVGPALGIGAAAAAVAFGAEQIAAVQAQAPQAAEGGMSRATTGGRLVNVSEGGSDEGIVPLDDPETARRIQQAAGTGTGDLTVQINVDGMQIAQAVTQGYNKGRNLGTVSKITTE